jgi:hypothetical protein
MQGQSLEWTKLPPEKQEQKKEHLLSRLPELASAWVLE